jgi:uncharacterized cupredoxin-like copper-binding protein
MRIRRMLAVAAVATIAVIAAGCGAAATPSPAASVAAGTIAVELKEWSVTASSATAPAGSVTFNVTNSGTAVHEFVVVKTDTKAADLPVADGKIDESALTPVDEIEDIAVGATPSLTVDLDAGHYVLLCNIEGHYSQGMHADLDVS